MPTGELLVVLEADPPPGLRDRLRSRFRVTQEGSARLLVVAGVADAAAVRALPGVRAVFDETVSADAVPDLDPGESLFLEAWTRQPSMRTKTRPGEGLSWDAPGRRPPDPPPNPTDTSEDIGG